MFRNVLFMALLGLLFPACGGDESKPPSGESEGEGSSEGEGDGSHAEGEGEGTVSGEGEGHTGEGEGEGPVCACTVNADCDDGNFCNGAETCDCTCSPGVPPTCADEFECTEDRCANNTCVNVPAHARCGAGKICRPAEGGCVAPPPCRDDADCVPDDLCQVGSCDEATRACEFAPFDGDEDGHAPIVCGGDDCDDSTGAVSPDREEECNEIDDNCNGEVDDGFADVVEICNQDDDDCDGQTDEAFDLQTDRENCSRCGNACRGNLVCTNGTCGCAPSFDTCEQEDVCISLQSDNQHCGVCGNECLGGSLCRDGQCVCDDERLTACPGIGCVNLQENQEYCGACDNSCEERIDDYLYGGSTCITGVCRCFVWNRTPTPCDSDLQCQVEADATDRCFDGMCAFISQNSIECDGQCVNQQYGNHNCGACGNVCEENEQCIEGQCRSCPNRREQFCQEEFDDEGRPAFVCTNLQNDASNCGQCGLDCGPGYICTEGTCACAPDAGHCEFVDGEEYCTDLDVDMWNCGQCDNVCSPYGSECQNGQCGDCVQTWEFEEPCNGACVVCGDGLDLVCTLTATDRYNCGRCGNECAFGAECERGQCSDCVQSWEFEPCNGACVICDGMADVFFDNDRVCAVTATDEMNCGRCGNRCDPNQNCNEGRCVNRN